MGLRSSASLNPDSRIEQPLRLFKKAQVAGKLAHQRAGTAYLRHEKRPDPERARPDVSKVQYWRAA